MNLDKYQQLEKIKLSYLKHRGNILEISEELGLPVDYIKKITDKFKKQEGRDVSILISNTLMSHILLGVKSRTAHLSEMLNGLNQMEKPLLSICHDMPVEVIEDSFKDRYRCLKCKKPCEVIAVPEVDIYDIKTNIIEQLREEDKSLIEMAKTMGYTNKEEQPPAPVFKQNILVMGGGETNPQVLQDIKHLPPIEKEKLMEKLRKEMLEMKDKIDAEPA